MNCKDNKFIDINSHSGSYRVEFISNPNQILSELADCVVFIDETVRSISTFPSLNEVPIITVRPSEDEKSFGNIEKYLYKLRELGVTRSHRLIAIGGGVTQDIVSFLSQIYFRGLKWWFLPTTLLAQCDSCVGSKSSINLGRFKNSVGGFHPPEKIFIDVNFLNSLDLQAVQSGIGELLKIFLIFDRPVFFEFMEHYDDLLRNRNFLKYISHALRLKRNIIEIDEFDRCERRVMNYGHGFGHAFETISNFTIPHGIAVTAGLDCANFVGKSLHGSNLFDHVSHLLRRNFDKKNFHGLSGAEIVRVMENDKKNVPGHLALVLPDRNSDISLFQKREKQEVEYLIESWLESL